MPTATGEPISSRHAITDLYDEQRGTFLIQYPILLVLGLALSGVVAFALTGFLGYPRDGGFSGAFHQAWFLFLWLAALLVTLLASIFRDKSLRGQLIASLIVSFLAIALVGITYFSQSLPDIIRQLLNQHRLLVTLAQSTYTYSAINFGLLAIFWADTIHRWMRRARGETPNPWVDIGLDSGKPTSKNSMPSLQELISGDLIAGAVLTALLAGLFWVGFLPNFIHPQGVHVTACNLSWLAGHCGVGGTPADPPTLTFIDLFQTLVYLPVGLLILALSATLSGFGAVGGVNEVSARGPLAQATGAERSGAMPIAEDVATTVIDTLKAALDRRLRMLGSSLALSLRTVAWPCLIAVAVYCLANLATNIEAYLHSGKDVHALLTWVIPAAVYGVVAVLASVISPALVLFRWRVAENTLRFMGLIGFIVLLAFWIFSLALMLVDRLLRFTGATPPSRHPFYPPSFATAVSFLTLMIFGLVLLLRRGRQGQREAAPVSAGAGVTAPENGVTPQARS